MPHRHGADDGLHHLSDARVLDERRRALEEAFFRKQEERQLQRLHERRERDAAREALARHCRITDAALLDRLLDLGLRAETVDALVLVPLALVAWADGAIDPHEREALLRAAADRGIAQGSPGHALLEGWTEHRPAPELLDAWRDYLRAVLPALDAEQRRDLETTLLGRARAVAEAAGGFLGIGSVSKAEETVLAALAAAFRSEA